jgi:Transposase domain (DUF772)
MTDGSASATTAGVVLGVLAWAPRPRRRTAIGRSIMLFIGRDLDERLLADANTIWRFRETLVRAAAIERVFERFEAIPHEKGWPGMAGHIVNATLVRATRSRLTGKHAGDTARQPEKAVGCSAAVILDELGAI